MLKQLARILLPSGACLSSVSRHRSPYHYHCFCEEVPNLQATWLQWQEGGRDAYLQQYIQQSAESERLTALYNEKLAEHENDVQLRQRAYDILVQDENLKASNARLCPKCSRTIEHTAACDLMICGQDYHGTS